MISQQLKPMEIIFAKLALLKDLKTELRYWCRQNGIKVSFTVNMTYTKSKAIYRKLQNTYKKGFGKVKTRWLENELKLFHFAVLGVSVLNSVKIDEFSHQQWQVLEEAFPNKLQPVLQYQAKNFTINKNALKQKWEEEEDNELIEIVKEKTDEPRWNQIAIELYIKSNRSYFRNGKQCRQRWLNHLDTSIKHDKWTENQDMVLMRGILEHGKKWSRIMKCFDNQRTEHMIKNRFLSLILKCKKMFPFIQDEESAIKKIFQEMGFSSDDSRIAEHQIYNERKLRPKNIQEPRSFMVENQSQCESPDSQEREKEKEKESSKNETIIVSQAPLPSALNPYECLKFNSFATLATPSPNFMNPLPYLSYNQIYPSYGYFQCYMNDFYSHLNSGNSSTNHM